MSNLKLFKFISGEEAVANVVKETATTVEINNAVTLVYHQVAEGKMSVGFAPFMPYADGDISLEKTAIAASAPPTEQIANEHLRVFSGIVLPGSSTKLA